MRCRVPAVQGSHDESGLGTCFVRRSLELEAVWLKPTRSGFSLNRIISALGIEKIRIDVGIKNQFQIVDNCLSYQTRGSCRRVFPRQVCFLLQLISICQKSLLIFKILD